MALKMANPKRATTSMETILTFENRNASQWSVLWSTTNIPDMDNASGGGARRSVVGRRRLRLGTFALGAILTMHCRVSASALTGGCIVFMMSLTAAVAGLANPLRHFEIYLGQWSISGPGRAFRIIPMLDGIGIAICINAIVRAITCCTMAAISMIYVVHSVSDAKLPFTYCRDFDLKSYDPIQENVKGSILREARFSLKALKMNENVRNHSGLTHSATTAMYERTWKNNEKLKNSHRKQHSATSHQLNVCNETYFGGYPAIYSTPAYNFFYVEVVHLRQDYSFADFNMPLLWNIIITWAILWALLIGERIFYGRLIWNNTPTWFICVPWCWSVILLISGLTNLYSMPKKFHKVFRISTKGFISGLADALEVAVYIHSASVGTELIHGKGLNHYASGHIDPHLNNENIWHSGLLLLQTALHSVGSTVCALVDYMQPETQGGYNMAESSLWIIPMYSKCTSYGSHTRLITTLIFSGLTFSYMAAAHVLLKTALHGIFEYRVKLVFIEQVVVGALIITCMGFSLPFATNGGIALLDSVDSLMTGVAMPLVCLLELVALLYVYRSRDFISDMNLSTEDNACSSRIATQWQIIPFITVATLIIKITVLVRSELPTTTMTYAVWPLVAVMIAVPIRTCHNAYVFFKMSPRRNV